MTKTLLPELTNTASSSTTTYPLFVDFEAEAKPMLLELLLRVRPHARPKTLASCEKIIAEILSQAKALWYLGSFTVSMMPSSEGRIEEYDWIHVHGYIAYIDGFSQKHIGFKLTGDTIHSLLKYYDTCNDKTAQAKSREDFDLAITKHVFQISVDALEELEADGTGELKGDDTQCVWDDLHKLLGLSQLSGPTAATSSCNRGYGSPYISQSCARQTIPELYLEANNYGVEEVRFENVPPSIQSIEVQQLLSKIRGNRDRPTIAKGIGGRRSGTNPRGLSYRDHNGSEMAGIYRYITQPPDASHKDAYLGQNLPLEQL